MDVTGATPTFQATDALAEGLATQALNPGVVFYKNSGQDAAPVVLSSGYFNSLISAYGLKTGMLIFDEYNNMLLNIAVTNGVVTTMLASNPLPLMPGAFGYYDAAPANINAGAPADGDKVSSWADLSGVGLPLLQATSAQQPTWNANVGGSPAIHFTGGTIMLQTANYAAAQAQPNTIYLLGRYAAFTATSALYDGGSTGRNLWWVTATPQWQIYAGTAVGTVVPDMNWHVFTAVFNGASSTMQIDLSPACAGGLQTALNAGAQGMSAFTLGNGYGGANGLTGYIKTAICCSGAHTPEQQLPIQKWLMKKGGLL